MPIDPRIALGVQPLQIADPLAQYGQVQNILAAQDQRRAAGTQNELANVQLAQAQMSMRQTQEARDTVTKIMGEIGKHGGPADPMEAAMQMLKDPRPEVQATGDHLLNSYQKVLAYQQDKSFANRTAPQPAFRPAASITPGALGSGTFDANAPVAAPIATQAQRSAAPTGVNLPPFSASTNQLAPATATALAATNALGTPSKADQILEKINDLRTRFPYSVKAKEEIAFLTERYKEASKTHVVGRNLVSSAGENIFTSPQDITPSDIKRLTAERDALPVGHPNRKLYDQAIANLGSTERLAQDRLNFDRDKFAWEKANPGYTIQQAEDGSIVGVNNRSLQAFPVNLSTTPPPATAPFAGSARTAPGGVDKRGGAVAPAAEPIIQPRGEALKGKSSGLTESQGNATAFGMRMLESDNLLSNLEKAGTISGGRIRGAVEGTLTSLIPYQGANLAEGAGSIMNAMPGFLGGPSSEQQQYDQAKRNFITAVLRKESGASIGASEFLNEEKKYFPQAGEDDKVIKQKQRARKLAIDAMKIQAGPGSKSIVETSPSTPGAKSASDPLGLFK